MDKLTIVQDEMIEADETFQEAFKDQFGPRGDWRSVPVSDYNEKTCEAYDNKLATYKAYIDTFRS
jgi:hypothetical protein